MFKGSGISFSLPRRKPAIPAERQSARAIVTRTEQGPLAWKAAVIWIDWYSYHIARFQALLRNTELDGLVAGVELVGGVGVHAGLRFREDIPASLPVQTLFRASNWSEVAQWKLACAVWHCLEKLNPSTVLVPGYYTLPALAAALWAKLNRKRPVLMTESTAQDHTRVWWREALKKLLVNGLFEWAVAGGAPHRSYLTKLGFPSTRVAGFYDVIDNEFFHERCRDIRALHRPNDFGLPPEYFLYVGRIAAEKNISALVAAYEQYREAGGNWHLVIVGDGPRLKEIQASSEKARYASDIHFTGLKPTSQLPPYYAFASAFVLPSLREPWGLVVNEAMAASLPVIVSQSCGCVEDLVQEGKNGFAFDPVQPDSLTQSMLKLSQLTIDERTKMGRNSCDIVSRFSPAAWASEVARIVSSER